MALPSDHVAAVTAAKRFSNAMLRAFLAAIKAGQNAVTRAALLEAIRTGDLRGISLALGEVAISEVLRKAATPVYGAVARPVARAALQEALRRLSGPSAESVDLARVLTHSLHRANRQAADFIVGVTKSQRQAVRVVLDESLEIARGPDDVARVLGDTLGLDPQQAKSYARRVDNLTPDEAEKLRRKMLDYRGRRAAHTETLGSGTRARHSMWESLVDQGVVRPGEFGRRCRRGPDTEACPICDPYDMLVAELGQEYALGGLGPPWHPWCDCYEEFLPMTVLRGNLAA